MEITTLIFSALSSSVLASVLSLTLNSLVFEPKRDEIKYIFDEKKRVYDSIIVFAQIVLYPAEAKYSLGVSRYDIQKLTNEEMTKNAMNDLRMAIPKLMLINKNRDVVEATNVSSIKKTKGLFRTSSTS
jgi:pheromone shutdown protein TraB